MGIRFHCDACDHKLHVKQFLAGKRGVCPHCGASIVIPNASTLPESADKRADSGKPVKKKAASSGELSPAPGVSTRTRKDRKQAVPTPRPEPAATSAQTVEDAPDLDPSTSVTEEFMPNSGADSMQDSIRIEDVAGRSVVDDDPINEVPDAVWYVRPPSGGQFGPAGGQLMRRWIGEGRVGADSLVWREGWEDWCLAATVFPGLAPDPPKVTDDAPAAAAAAPEIETPSAAEPKPINESQNKILAYSRRKSRNNTLAIAAIVILSLMSVALAVVLFVIIL